MRTFLIALLALLPLLACANLNQAGIEPMARVTFEPPTERMNGDPLDPATEIAAYNLYCRHVAEAFPEEPVVIAGFVAGARTVQIPRDEITTRRGQIECVMTAVDTEGLMSLPSNTATTVWFGPPGNVRNLEARN